MATEADPIRATARDRPYYDTATPPGRRAMRYLSVLPRFLLNLTFPVRLAIAICSVLFVLLVYILMGSAR
ncbi:MAG TPA: hypothetical protein VFQ30_12705, partial [Ktedonobacteraceae bacterium]|nr:hypothetical protein [Ktedonobacteraceae bacterium]